MRFYASILVLFLLPSALSADEIPFSINADKFLKEVIAAVSERYPDVSPNELELQQDVYVHCWSNRPNEQIFALDEEFMPCFVGVNFDLTSTSVKSKYIDKEGNCKISDPKRLNVQIHQGRIRLSMGLESGTKNRVVECTEEFISQAVPPLEQPFDDKTYVVDAKKILNIAYATVIEDYSDISPDDLELNGPVRLSCKPTNAGARISAVDVKFAPCTAFVNFNAPSSIIEYKYIDANGNCNIMRGPETLKVQIGASGSTPTCGRGGFSVTEERVVECTDAFNDAEKWTNN